MYRYELYVQFNWLQTGWNSTQSEQLKEIKDWCYQTFGDEGDRWIVERVSKGLDSIYVFKLKYDRDGTHFALRWE